jgi:hypothetical protein
MVCWMCFIEVIFNGLKRRTKNLRHRQSVHNTGSLGRVMTFWLRVVGHCCCCLCSHLDVLTWWSLYNLVLLALPSSCSYSNEPVCVAAWHLDGDVILALRWWWTDTLRVWVDAMVIYQYQHEHLTLQFLIMVTVHSVCSLPDLYIDLQHLFILRWLITNPSRVCCIAAFYLWRMTMPFVGAVTTSSDILCILTSNRWYVILVTTFLPLFTVWRWLRRSPSVLFYVLSSTLFDVLQNGFNTGH